MTITVVTGAVALSLEAGRRGTGWAEKPGSTLPSGPRAAAGQVLRQRGSPAPVMPCATAATPGPGSEQSETSNTSTQVSPGWPWPLAARRARSTHRLGPPIRASPAVQLIPLPCPAHPLLARRPSANSAAVTTSNAIRDPGWCRRPQAGQSMSVSSGSPNATRSPLVHGHHAGIRVTKAAIRCRSGPLPPRPAVTRVIGIPRRWPRPGGRPRADPGRPGEGSGGLRGGWPPAAKGDGEGQGPNRLCNRRKRS